MDTAELVERVQELTDLELAVLLSLVAAQHCIITADEDDVDSMVQELQLVWQKIPLYLVTYAERLADCYECFRSIPCSYSLQQFNNLGRLKPWDSSEEQHQRQAK